MNGFETGRWYDQGIHHRELEITNRPDFEPYRHKVRATVEAHGGRFLVRGLRAREEWYNSSGYQEILPIRLNSSTGRVILARGVPPR
jgi:uncharacterized protein (DUF1330 family)